MSSVSSLSSITTASSSGLSKSVRTYLSPSHGKKSHSHSSSINSINFKEKPPQLPPRSNTASFSPVLDPEKSPNVNGRAKPPKLPPRSNTASFGPVLDVNRRSSDVYHFKGIKSSSLLQNTPPPVSKLLISSYPYWILIDKILSVLTWKEDYFYYSASITLLMMTFIYYFEIVIVYLGYIMVISFLSLYAQLAQIIDEEQQKNATMDDIVHRVYSVNEKSSKLLAPIAEVRLAGEDLQLLLCTTMLLTLVYGFISRYFLPPRLLLTLIAGFLLTFHSTSARHTRRWLWQFKEFRRCFYFVLGLSHYIDRTSNKYIVVNDPREIITADSKEEVADTTSPSIPLNDFQNPYFSNPSTLNIDL
ncbi:unnamed protein product [Ambrosiozyma monospora]|uniref:Unnamed protein product n=1 Tax=Ambrosiozyma monospora TaxID=43982 RepID=A0A9W6YQG5_AMBMO|nr:unnamed protein product [Ambrosiozyma monospora]